MSITYPPELLPSPDEGQGADVWVQCTCGCAWDPTMLASCPVCDPKEITDSKDAISRCEFCGNQYGDDRCGCDAAKDAEITKLKSQLEEARAALKPFVEEFEARRDAYIRRYPRNQSVGASNFDSMPGEWPMEGSVFSMRVFRQARSVLDAHKEGGK